MPVSIFYIQKASDFHAQFSCVFLDSHSGQTPVDIYDMQKASDVHVMLLNEFSNYPVIQMKLYRVGTFKASNFHEQF
jgi:hypothetical protein